MCLGIVEVTRVCGEPCDVGSCVRTPTIPYGITVDINHILLSGIAGKGLNMIQHSSNFRDRSNRCIVALHEGFRDRLKESLPLHKHGLVDSMFESLNLYAQEVESLEANLVVLKDNIYKKSGEITDLHTRINTLDHLLELARSKND